MAGSKGFPLTPIRVPGRLRTECKSLHSLAALRIPSQTHL